jgi:VIT1/CCC1 family predicted Fe2+/Mn2+ transporter
LIGGMIFHVMRDGEALGDLEERDFREKIFSGEIQPEDYYWREGFGDWKLVSEYRAPAREKVVKPAAPPPLPAIASDISQKIQRWGARNAEKAAENKEARIGGLCAVLGAFAPLLSPVFFVLLSLPLLFAAFVLAILSLARGKITGGILLLIGLMFAFAMSFAALTERDKILHHPEQLRQK